jgi:hypothetical protein
LKTHQYKPTRLTAGKKTLVTLRTNDGSLRAFLSNADAVVEEHASQSLAGAGPRLTERKVRSTRASYLPQVERELAELKKVVAALAVRSVAHEEQAIGFDTEGMTIIDAETAYQLLDNPPEPSEELRRLLTLR